MKKSYILWGLFLVLLSVGGYMTLSYLGFFAKNSSHIQITTEKQEYWSSLISLNTTILETFYEKFLSLALLAGISSEDLQDIRDIYEEYLRNTNTKITILTKYTEPYTNLVITIESDHSELQSFFQKITQWYANTQAEQTTSILSTITEQKTKKQQLQTLLSSGYELGTYIRTEMSLQKDASLWLSFQENVFSINASFPFHTGISWSWAHIKQLIAHLPAPKQYTWHIVLSRHTNDPLLEDISVVKKMIFSSLPENIEFFSASINALKEGMEVNAMFFDKEGKIHDISDIANTIQTHREMPTGLIFEKMKVTPASSSTMLVIHIQPSIVDVIHDLLSSSIKNSLNQARDDTRMADLRDIAYALFLYHSNHSQYPSGAESGCVADLAEILTPYIHIIPTDPLRNFGIQGCEHRGGYGYKLLPSESTYILSARMEWEEEVNFDGGQWKNIEDLSLGSGYLKIDHSRGFISDQNGASRKVDTLSPDDWYYLLVEEEQ